MIIDSLTNIHIQYIYTDLALDFNLMNVSKVIEVTSKAPTMGIKSYSRGNFCKTYPLLHYIIHD